LEKAKAVFEVILTQPIKLLSPEQLHSKAWELAKKLNRPTAYDAHHLALAGMLGCEFWTADEQSCNAVKEQLPWVRWLGDYQLGV